MKYTLILLVSVFISIQVISQEKNEDLLRWSAARKLSWNDYKASPNPSSDAAATTTTYLKINYHISTDSFGYIINSWFSRTRSWGRNKNSYILAHEQGHFDIAEIFARKLNQRMKNYTFNRRTYDKDLDRIYKETADEKSAYQRQYDKETNHSINREKQAEWLLKIEKELEELKAWADY